jgi:acetylornithine/succinyldiaminopimelate/putrescine aminotransferase
MIGADAKDKEIVKKCADNGVLINSPHPGAIRLLPALTITEKEMTVGITRMKAAFSGGE